MGGWGRQGALSPKRDLVFAPLPLHLHVRCCALGRVAVLLRGLFCFITGPGAPVSRRWTLAALWSRRRKARSGGAGGEGAVSALPPFPARPAVASRSTFYFEMRAPPKIGGARLSRASFAAAAAASPSLSAPAALCSFKSAQRLKAARKADAHPRRRETAPMRPPVTPK